MYDALLILVINIEKNGYVTELSKLDRLLKKPFLSFAESYFALVVIVNTLYFLNSFFTHGFWNI